MPDQASSRKDKPDHGRYGRALHVGTTYFLLFCAFLVIIFSLFALASANDPALVQLAAGFLIIASLFAYALYKVGDLVSGTSADPVLPTVVSYTAFVVAPVVLALSLNRHILLIVAAALFLGAFSYRLSTKRRYWLPLGMNGLLFGVLVLFSNAAIGMGTVLVVLGGISLIRLK